MLNRKTCLALQGMQTVLCIVLLYNSPNHLKNKQHIWFCVCVFCQVEAYDNDELNYHGRLRVSFGIQLMGAAERIEREIPSISWPFLILHGDDDKLCDIRGSKMMHEKAASSDKKLKVGFFVYKCKCLWSCRIFLFFFKWLHFLQDYWSDPKNYANTWTL